MDAEIHKNAAEATSNNTFGEEVPVADDDEWSDTEDSAGELEAAKARATRLQRKFNSFLQENFYTKNMKP